ncbi:hypothetical protein SAMN04489727_8517 [Amycolatopsis tolypomycina]|uniref:Uncharacterized protein n=1 Tax=Amycolatopsis tolypomycina TaxID=208445 RepID=A0A1H5BZ63_9PSEU|nr:hypothetical protein [Amycolatopsis tolypomycina]SED59686.1 hypothetical protein SAMN04489727_8517 [Amycolatopsis tolypomycina]
MFLAELLDRTGLDVLDHLDRQVTVPVIDGLQAQGDLIVLPLALLGRQPRDWWELPAEGRELVRGEAGNNPHTLVADRGTCRMTTWLKDPEQLAIAAFENTAPVWLIHPEHGATGIAPGAWFVRRQREPAAGFRKPALVAD